MKKSIIAPKILLVEGKEEINFISAFLKRKYGFTEIIQEFSNEVILEKQNQKIQLINIDEKENFDELFCLLKLLPNIGKLKVLGIFKYPDINQRETFNTICKAIQQNELVAPEGMGQFSSGAPKIGVYVLPDHKRNFRIESVCIKSQETHPLMKEVDTFLNLITSNTKCAQPKNLVKAKCQAFLSVMPESVSNIAQAAEKGYWNFEADCFKPLHIFLNNMLSV